MDSERNSPNLVRASIGLIAVLVLLVGVGIGVNMLVDPCSRPTSELRGEQFRDAWVLVKPVRTGEIFDKSHVVYQCRKVYVHGDAPIGKNAIRGYYGKKFVRDSRQDTELYPSDFHLGPADLVTF